MTTGLKKEAGGEVKDSFLSRWDWNSSEVLIGTTGRSFDGARIRVGDGGGGAKWWHGRPESLAKMGDD